MIKMFGLSVDIFTGYHTYLLDYFFGLNRKVSIATYSNLSSKG